MSHTTRAFSKATFPVVVTSPPKRLWRKKRNKHRSLVVWHHACKLLLKNTIITLILLFYPLFGKDNLSYNSLRESRWMKDGCTKNLQLSLKVCPLYSVVSVYNSIVTCKSPSLQDMNSLLIFVSDSVDVVRV